MRALFTKYHGATETKGGRVIASDEEGHRVTVTSGQFEEGRKAFPTHYKYEGDDGWHVYAVEQLCRKMGWKGSLQGGHCKRGMVWVFTYPMSACPIAFAHDRRA